MTSGARPADGWGELAGRNPFLLREWRRAHRRAMGPMVPPMVLCGAAVLSYVLVIGVCAGLEWAHRANALGFPVSSSLSGNGARLVGTWIVGLAAWSALLVAYWLAVEQTYEEEKQSTLDMLLVTPLSRGAVVRLLLAWPVLNVAAVLGPLLPLLAVVAPFLGLSFWGAVRMLVVMCGAALLVALRAPSGAGAQAAVTSRRTVLQVVGYATALVALVPFLSYLSTEHLGLTGFSLLRWPIAAAEALAARPAFWSGTTALGGWVLAVFVLLVVARWLSAWSRLNEGSEESSLPAMVAAWPAGLVMVWLIAGLWWGHSTATGREERLWFGLHAAMLLVFAGGLGSEPTRRPLAWLPRQGLGGVLLGLLDTALTAAAASGLWWLGLRVAAVPAVAPDWTTPLEVLGAGLLLNGLAVVGARPAERRRRGPAPALRLAQVVGAVVVGGWVVYGLSRLGPHAGAAGGWTGAFFGWPTDVWWLVMLVGLTLSLSPLLSSGTARAGAASDASGLFWRFLAAPWHDNPLATKAQRSLRRQRLGRLGALATAVLGVLGFAPAGAIAWLGAGTAAASTSTLVVVILAAALVSFGQAAGRVLFGLDLPVMAAAMVAQMVLVSGIMAVALLCVAAAALGTTITDERYSGNLGFLFLSSLTDRDIAEGLLIGHGYAALELLFFLSLSLLGWGLVAWHWAPVVTAVLLILYLAGLTLSAAGLALLGTARYHGRASGTLVSIVGTASFQGTAVFGLVMVTAIVKSEAPRVLPPGWPLACAAMWSGMTAFYGLLLWSSGAGAIRRMRRAARIGRAFELTGQKE